MGTGELDVLGGSADRANARSTLVGCVLRRFGSREENGVWDLLCRHVEPWMLRFHVGAAICAVLIYWFSTVLEWGRIYGFVVLLYCGLGLLSWCAVIGLFCLLAAPAVRFHRLLLGAGTAVHVRACPGGSSLYSGALLRMFAFVMVVWLPFLCARILCEERHWWDWLVLRPWETVAGFLMPLTVAVCFAWMWFWCAMLGGSAMQLGNLLVAWLISWLAFSGSEGRLLFGFSISFVDCLGDYAFAVAGPCALAGTVAHVLCRRAFSDG